MQSFIVKYKTDTNYMQIALAITTVYCDRGQCKTSKLPHRQVQRNSMEINWLIFFRQIPKFYHLIGLSDVFIKKGKVFLVISCVTKTCQPSNYVWNSKRSFSKALNDFSHSKQNQFSSC